MIKTRRQIEVLAMNKCDSVDESMCICYCQSLSASKTIFVCFKTLTTADLVSLFAVASLWVTFNLLVGSYTREFMYLLRVLVMVLH